MKAITTEFPAEICNRKMTESNISFLGNSYYLPPEDSHRNAPCPCGSGKKYKRCCGKNDIPKKTKKIYVCLMPIRHPSGKISDKECVLVALCEDGRMLGTRLTSYDSAKNLLDTDYSFRHKFADACPFGYELEWIERDDVSSHEGYERAMALYRQRNLPEKNPEGRREKR